MHPTLLSRLGLQSRVALVTGAGAGLGEAIAHELAASGAMVGVLDRDEDAAERAARSLESRGGRALALCADISDPVGVGQQLDRLLGAQGRLDIVVNGAGVVSRPGMPFTNNTPDDWRRTLDVNLMGAVHVCAAARAALVASPCGRIVNVSSITGVISAPYMPPYSVSKAALISFTKVLARELAAEGVCVNAVCPGFIWTPLWEGLGPAMAAKAGAGQDGRAVFDQRVQAHVPMRRPQTAADVAALVAFLSSDAAENITGQVIGVDGGVTI